MKKLVTTLSLLIGFTAFSLVVEAQPRGGGHYERGVMENFDRVADKIGLSEEQRGKIADIIDASRLAHAVDRERVEQIHEQMKNTSGAFDAERVKKLADELGQITARLAFARAETHSKVSQLLTAEQRETWQAMRKEHKAASYRRGRGPGSPGHIRNKQLQGE